MDEPPAAVTRTTRRSPRWTHAPIAASLVLLTVLALAPALPAAAQDDEKVYKDVATESQESMRNAVYQELAKAQEKAEAGQYGEAIKILDTLREKEELNSYELAQAWNLYAFVYYSQDRLPAAISAYEKLLAQGDLPAAMRAGTLQTLSQLYFATEQWQKAIETLQRWMKEGQDPTPQQYELLAQAYYQLKEYRKVIEPAREAIRLTVAEGLEPSENLYLLQRVAYYELDDFPKVVEVLHELIERFPKKQYWMQLISVYGEMGDEKKQLYALQCAHVLGFLDTEGQLVTLASLLLQNDLPYNAGRVMEKGLADGTITSTQEHWQLLAQAWTLAHEDAKAIPALSKAAQMSDNGQLYLVLAQSYINLERWEDAARATRAGLDKGGLRSVGQARVMLGQVLFNMGQLEEARRVFQSAQEDPASRQLAAQWMSYIDNEVDRRAELRDALED